MGKQHTYTDVIVSYSSNKRIGTLKLNRPKALNSFGGRLMIDLVAGLRELNEHPATVFTVLTGEGRFVSVLVLLFCLFGDGERSVVGGGIGMLSRMRRREA
jgi:1,4-dihydroxy-2-naphthoyl-CoA synthase